MFNTGDMFAVAAENWVGSVCCLVYFWERRLPDQHNVPDGAPEAAEEDVRENQGFRHRHYADMPCADPVCCLLVEEQWPCVAVLHFAILGFGLVWLVLYSLCKGCGDKDVLPLPEVSSLSTHSVPLQLPPCFWTTKRPLCFLAQSNDTGATPAGTSSTSLRNGL